MFDKALIAVWILLGSILVIENIVSGSFWYLFLDRSANNWTVVFVSILIWLGMWLWIRGIFLSKKELDDEDEYDF